MKVESSYGSSSSSSIRVICIRVDSSGLVYWTSNKLCLSQVGLGAIQLLFCFLHLLLYLCLFFHFLLILFGVRPCDFVRFLLLVTLQLLSFLELLLLLLL